MTSTLICQDEQRRHLVRGSDLNGVDYLEVSEDQLTLTVYFLKKAPPEITKANVRIDGGRRIRDIQVIDVRLCRVDDPDLDDCMKVTVDKYGDFSTYTLRLVEADERGRPGQTPLAGFDPRYAQLDFTFKVDCPSEFDCQPQDQCPPPALDEPDINYLAKDYASFRQVMLDRLALIMPDWRERLVPDIGITLVELLAYVGDYLSYYQDAVATEAYLDTARLRTSVRRHARLVDYLMHEGCNARAWLHIATDIDVTLTPDVSFITGVGDSAADALTWPDLQNVPPDQYETFEPMVEGSMQLYAAHNRLEFYTWGDRECCLTRGATAATLIDDSYDLPTRDNALLTLDETSAEGRKLKLKPGDFLLFEELLDPKTGVAADANPAHRHVVRLTQVRQDVDPVTNQAIVDIEWAADDALPFPLCISAIGRAPECQLLTNISVARGNIVLVDHGRRVREEDLGCVPIASETIPCEESACGEDALYLPGRFSPRFEQAPLTFRQPLPSEGSARALMQAQDPRLALPWVRLTGQAPGSQPLTQVWEPRHDLLSSGPDDTHFVVEIDNDGVARLRFGDGELGEQPGANVAFTTTYRVGNGPSGNVGADTITRIVFGSQVERNANLRPRNPLPAWGGLPPEPIMDVKLLAPTAFRKRLERAITADDYARLAEQESRVQRAAAVLRWTGGWTEVRVAIDPRDAPTADEALLSAVRRRLERYRRLNHDVRVVPATYVPLHVALTVCVKPNYLKGHVKAALLQVFGARRLPDGRLGFFHPDNLSFGGGIYLSQLVAAAQAVPGVETVVVKGLRRWTDPPNNRSDPNDPLEQGVLPLGPLEIAQLDNDPTFPENGKLELTLAGGR